MRPAGTTRHTAPVRGAGTLCGTKIAAGPVRDGGTTRSAGSVRRLLVWAVVVGAAAGGVIAVGARRGRIGPPVGDASGPRAGQAGGPGVGDASSPGIARAGQAGGPRVGGVSGRRTEGQGGWRLLGGAGSWWPGGAGGWRAAGRLTGLRVVGPAGGALDEAQTDFMSTVSHELRTPLTSISGYAEMLRDAEPGELSEAQLRMVEAIVRNARRLRELVEDILTQSRIESGGFATHPAALDLAQLVERAVSTLEPAAAKASVGLRAEVSGPLPLRGDGVQLDRVLASLIGNAVKFTPAAGTVTVRAERRDDQAVLVIADTGMGIPASEQNALFGRFFRATNALHHAVPGAGLGLAITRKIVHNHGGTIHVRSTENVGTTVTVRLPAEQPKN